MDDFGADPQVRAMRAVFRSMEEFDLAAAKGLGLGRHDARLRPLRRAALTGLEQSLARAKAPLGPDDYLGFYQAAYRRAAEELGLTWPEVEA